MSVPPDGIELGAAPQDPVPPQQSTVGPLIELGPQPPDPIPPTIGTLDPTRGQVVLLPELPRVIIGPFTFTLNPREQINVTGASRLAEHNPPGGGPRYQYMGEAAQSLRFAGILDGPNAIDELRRLLALKGSKQSFQYNGLTAGVWVEDVQWSYVRADRMRYDLSLKVEFPATAVHGGALVTAPAQAQGQAVTTNPAAQTVATRPYVVKSGDNLFSICARELGDGTLFDVVARVNALDDPDSLTPGQVLLLPVDAAAARALRGQQSADAALLPTS